MSHKKQKTELSNFLIVLWSIQHNKKHNWNQLNRIIANFEEKIRTMIIRESIKENTRGR